MSSPWAQMTLELKKFPYFFLENSKQVIYFNNFLLCQRKIVSFLKESFEKYTHLSKLKEWTQRHMEYQRKWDFNGSQSSYKCYIL
jgi:hypothetical protein